MFHLWKSLGKQAQNIMRKQFEKASEMIPLCEICSPRGIPLANEDFYWFSRGQRKPKKQVEQERHADLKYLVRENHAKKLLFGSRLINQRYRWSVSKHKRERRASWVAEQGRNMGKDNVRNNRVI